MKIVWKVIRGVLFLPVLVVLCVVVAAILVPAWVLSFIPIIGSSIFVGLMVVASPFMMLAQYFGFAVGVSFSEVVTISGHHLVMRRLARKSEVIEPSEVSAIRDYYNPPFPTFDIVFKTGGEHRIGALSDMDVVFGWAEQHGIEVLGRESESASAS